MAYLNLSGNLKPLIAALQSDRRAVRIAAIAAMNKCATQIRTAGVRQLAKAVRIPTRAVRSRVKVTRAYDLKVRYASVITLNRPFPIDRLGPREIKRGGFSAVGRRFPHAFRTFGVTGTAAQQRIIFQRRGKARLPIDRVGIPIAQEADAVFRPLFQRFTGEKLPALFEHEMKRRFGAQ